MKKLLALTMHIQNWRFISKFNSRSPLQILNGLISLKTTIAYFAFTQSYENAAAERINCILKNELYLDQCFFDTEKAKLATKSAIKLYNNKILHLFLGNKPPITVFESTINKCLTCSHILGQDMLTKRHNKTTTN